MSGNSKKSKLSSYEGILSPEDLETIRNEAKHKVKEDSKKEAKKKALELAIREEKSKVNPEDALEKYQIDLPGYSDGIVLDGIKYVQGVTYTFTAKQISTIKDIVHCAWRHENDVGGVNRKSYVAPREFGYDRSYGLSGAYGRFR